MFALFTPLVRLIAAPAARFTTGGVARRLMESAGARAGHNAQQAEELRSAAYAYLRVVR